MKLIENLMTHPLIKFISKHSTTIAIGGLTVSAFCCYKCMHELYKNQEKLNENQKKLANMIKASALHSYQNSDDLGKLISDFVNLADKIDRKDKHED